MMSTQPVALPKSYLISKDRTEFDPSLFDWIGFFFPPT